MLRLSLAALALCLAASSAAQSVDGVVTDAVTGDPLPGANVALLDADGAVRGGTSTNAEGRFSLRADFPAELAIRYIGYQTARVRLADAGPLAVALQPDVSSLGEVTVTPGEDPAVALMRRVIARTRAQRDALGPYAVTVYARTTIRDPEREIKGISEAASEAFWSPDGGWREVIVARKRTANLGGGGESAGAIAEGLLDLLAADVSVSGHRLYGPTHPDALGVYRFEIVGTQALDGELVVEVSLEPRRSTASAFVGTLQILFNSADVLAADLQPGPSFLFPPPIRVAESRFRQQYVPVAADSSLWLPADLQSTFGIGFGVDGLLQADPFFFDRAAQFSNYRLGAVAPDSLREGAAVRQAAALDSTRLATPGAAVPLTRGESEAYAAGDSLGGIEGILVFRGPLAPLARRGIVVSSGEAASDSTARRPLIGYAIEPQFGINPAETARLGAGLNLRVASARVIPYGAFRLADRGVSYGVDGRALLARLPDGGGWVTLVGGLADDVARRVAPSAPSFPTGVLDGPGGYYDSRRASVGLGLSLFGLGTIRDGGFFSFDTEAEARLRFVAETARTYAPQPASADGAFDDCRADDCLDLGPDGASTTVRSLRLDAAFGTLDEPAGLFPRRAVSVMVEGAPSFLAAGAPFWRADALIETRVETFGRRRVLPAALDLRLSGGVSGGDLPAIRQFAVEHALGEGAFGTSAFGSLRARTDRPEAGDRYAMLAWEHSFRTIPFEVLGLDGLARRAYNVIVHGAHARTWGGPLAAERAHHELGVSLSGLFGVFRLDLTQGLDTQNTVVGLGVARVF